MKKFDYIILNEDNEWLSTGKGETQKQLDEEIAIVKKREFDRWGEKTAIIIFKAPIMETLTI